MVRGDSGNLACFGQNLALDYGNQGNTRVVSPNSDTVQGIPVSTIQLQVSSAGLR